MQCEERRDTAKASNLAARLVALVQYSGSLSTRMDIARLLAEEPSHSDHRRIAQAIAVKALEGLKLHLEELDRDAVDEAIGVVFLSSDRDVYNAIGKYVLVSLSGVRFVRLALTAPRCCRALDAAKNSEREAIMKVSLELELLLRLSTANETEKKLIDLLMDASAPMKNVSAKTGGGAAAAEGSPEVFLVDIKDVILLGKKESLEFVVTYIICGWVRVTWRGREGRIKFVCLPRHAMRAAF